MMKPIDDHANPIVLKRIRQIRKLEDEHHALDHHWNGLALDARYSDHMFKHHIARLRAIYKHHVSPEMNVEGHTGMEDRAKLHMPAVTKLFGVDGIQAQVSDEKATLRELGWSDDVGVPTVRSAVSNKIRLMMQKGKASLARTNGPPSSGLDDGHVPTKSSADFEAMQAANTFRPRRTLRKRCSDPEITDEDVILLGKYRLSSKDHHVYSEFVHMLRRLDHYDVNSVIEDVWADLKESNRRVGYSGLES
jgi:hypothetical protein